MTLVVLIFLPVYLLLNIYIEVKEFRKKRRSMKKDYAVRIIFALLLFSLMIDPTIVMDRKSYTIKAIKAEDSTVTVQDIIPLAQNMRTTVYQVTSPDSDDAGIIAFTKVPGLPFYQAEFSLAGEHSEPFGFQSDLYFGEKYRFGLEGDTLTAYPISTLFGHFIISGTLIVYALSILDRTRKAHCETP